MFGVIHLEEPIHQIESYCFPNGKLYKKLILKHLVNQEPIILFMATIGLAYFMEGFGDLMWGSDVKTLNVGIPQGGSLWFEDFTIGWAAEGEKFYGMYVDLLDCFSRFLIYVDLFD